MLRYGLRISVYGRRAVLMVIIPSVLPRNLRPMRLSRRSAPFDSDDFIYELKIDGFRALAQIQNGEGELISRNGNTFFRGFADLALDCRSSQD